MKVSTPFLSLQARGAIGKTLIAQPWKNVSTIRKYTPPSNPNTPDQQTQRTTIAQATYAWKHFLTGHDSWELANVTAWNLYASTRKLKATGYHIAISSISKAVAINPDKVFADNVRLTVFALIATMQEMIAGTQGAEAGTFTMLAGRKPTQMIPDFTDVLHDGSFRDLNWKANHDPGVWYFQVVKDSIPRSGIWKLEF